MSARVDIDLTALKQEIIDSVLATLRSELGLARKPIDISTKSTTSGKARANDDYDFKREAADIARGMTGLALEDELEMRPRTKQKSRAELEAGLKGHAIWQHVENAPKINYERDAADDQWDALARVKYSGGSY